MATKKGTKQSNKINESLVTVVLHFGQFAMEELKKEQQLKLALVEQRTFLTEKSFLTDKWKPYEIVGPKFSAFIRLFFDAVKADHDREQNNSKYLKFMQRIKAKQDNLYLFELYKTSNLQSIRDIMVLINDISNGLVTNAVEQGDNNYVELAELLCVSLAILVHKASFINGVMLKDEQSFRRLFADLYSNGYFKLDGENNDATFMRYIDNLVTKTFEAPAKTGTAKKGGAKTNTQQTKSEMQTSADTDEVDSLLQNF